jgi:hypothetical protein
MFGEPSRDYRLLVRKLKRGVSIRKINLDLIFRVSAEGHHIPSLVAKYSAD